MTSSAYAVISAGGDSHLPFVQKHLDQPFTVIDPSMIMQGTPLSYRFINDAFEAFYNNVSLANVAAVWYRKPELSLRTTETQKKEHHEFTKHALFLFMRQLYGLLPDALWVSEYYAILKASDKLRQLTVAHRLGFRIPDTLVTSSASDAKQFVEAHDRTIAKPIEVKVFTLDGEQRIMLTQKIDKRTVNFSGLHLAPAIIQEAIDIAVDLRVTVVGEKTFAATVAPQSTNLPSSAVRDWRIGDHQGGTAIRPFDLPPAVARRCVRHVKEMGLMYGAIDLLLDKKGKFWFLENNPNGQWAFIEEATKQPIGQAIAQLLMSAKQRSQISSGSSTPSY